MAVGVAVCMLAACGSSEDVDVDAVSSYLFMAVNSANKKIEPISEKDCKMFG